MPLYSQNTRTYVVTESPRPATEGSESAVEIGSDVENRHDNRNECLDALVNTSSQPSGPASLRSTAHHEGLHLRYVESFNKFLNSVPIINTQHSLLIYNKSYSLTWHEWQI
jgi:hypothetical protein